MTFAPDALSVLRRDHRLAEELFAEFARSAPQQLDPLARRICKMLRVHTQIEEELFYPAVSRALTDDVSESPLLADAAREHAQAKESIVRIESMTSDDAGFRDEVAKLARQVGEHVAKEEQELFPQVQTHDHRPRRPGRRTGGSPRYVAGRARAARRR